MAKYVNISGEEGVLFSFVGESAIHFTFVIIIYTLRARSTP